MTRVRVRAAPGERLALFAECVLVGLFTLIAAAPLVTLLPACGAGCDHLAAHLDGRSTALSAYPRRLVRSLRRGGLGLGALLVLAPVVLALDLIAVRREVPGALPAAVLCGLAVVVLLVVALRAAAAWRSDGPAWPVLIREAAGRARADLHGSLLLAGGLVMVAASTWQLLPLAIPALGCLLMAALAVERRSEPVSRWDPPQPGIPPRYRL